MSFDLKRTYFGLAAFVLLMVVFVAGLSLGGAASSVAVLSGVPLDQRQPPGYSEQIAQGRPQGDWELQGAKEQLATSLAAVIVGLPAWLFHWRRFRRLAEEQQSYLLYRIYAYAAMVVTLVALIVAGGDLLRQPLLAMLGSLDLSTRFAQLSLTRGVVGSAWNLVWAFVVWWYHWRVAETAPRG